VEAGATLSPAFFDRPADAVARDLLGRILVSELGGRTAGRIVETEAYTGPEDPASHASASIGRTDRNDPMFGPPGTVYIHLNYGIHWCLNLVTGEEDHPAAVLLRALEPLEGRELMERRRGHPELTSGPARLTQALGISGTDLQRHRVDRPPLRVREGDGPVPGEHVERTPRVGVSRGAELPLRFLDARSRWVSR
jgi:DNA-3-methyladenine glycosylase